MVRKQIYLEDRQQTQLKRLARALGLSEAALIRQSLDRGLRVGTIRHRQPSGWNEVRAFIRKRMRKGPLPGQRTWRREDLYAR
jgi:hypothetical protein